TALSSFSCLRDHRCPHSFPTRRSSDLPFTSRRTDGPDLMTNAQPSAGPSSAPSDPEPRPARRTRALRVLVGIQRLAIGGMELNAIDLAGGLRERGHDVRLFADREDDRPLVGVASSRGVDIELLDPAGPHIGRFVRGLNRLI